MIYYAYGTALLSADEARDAQAPRQAADLVTAVSGSGDRSSHAAIDFGSGVLTFEAVAADIRSVTTTPWKPIGPGLPLTIDIREVYTGQHPNSWFGRSRPMLITTAVKGVATFDAKPRALNFLTAGTEPRTRLKRPKATAEGTPVVYHSPAAVDRSLTLDIAIVFDDFPEHAVKAIGNAFTSAAGVPVFLSASLYLLAAGKIAHIAGAAGEALFDRTPVFDTTEAVNLELPGTVPTAAGFMLVTPADIDTIDPDFRTTYQVQDGTVVDKAGRPYTGDIPYVVLGVDGSPRDELKAFAPTAASAAVLSRFYGLTDGSSQPLSPLLDALQLYNDASFRSEWDRVKRKLDATTDDAEKKALTERLAALRKNINNELFQPK